MITIRSIIRLKNSDNEVFDCEQDYWLLSCSELDDAERFCSRLFHDVFIDYVVKKIKFPVVIKNESEFWKIVLAPWLLFLLHTCYLNYLFLKKYCAHIGNERVEVAVPSRAPFAGRPETAGDLVEVMLHRDFHAWIVGQYVKNLISDKLHVVYYDVEQLNKCPNKKLSAIGSAKRILNRYLSMLRCTSEQIPLMVRFLFSTLLRFRRVRCRKQNAKDPTAAQQNFTDSRFNPTIDFIEGTKQIIDECTPKWYLDDFKKNYERINNRRYILGLGRIVNSDMFDDRSNLLKAIAVEKGEVVFSVQHGGGFGTHKVFCLSPESEYIGGPFISWGWSSHSLYKVDALPLPSPALSRLKKRRINSRIGTDALFIGTEISPFKLRVHSKPIGNQWVDYREQKISFLSSLSRDVFNQIIYRGGCSDIIEDSSYLLSSFPTLRLSHGSYSEFHRLLCKVRFCIIDHPITSLHQTLAMEVPTISYWNHSHWQLASQAIPMFSELERVGIVHRSGESAAIFLNSIFNNVDEWWLSRDVREVRTLWCENFARTSNHWMQDWVRALWKK